MRINTATPYDESALMFETEAPPIRVFEQTIVGLRELGRNMWDMTGNGFQLKQAPYGQMWAQVEP